MEEMQRKFPCPHICLKYSKSQMHSFSKKEDIAKPSSQEMASFIPVSSKKSMKKGTMSGTKSIIPKKLLNCTDLDPS
jgi:hypothetical protein